MRSAMPGPSPASGRATPPGRTTPPGRAVVVARAPVDDQPVSDPQPLGWSARVPSPRAPEPEESPEIGPELDLPGKGGRHKRAPGLASKLSAILGAVLLLVTGSVAAYRLWGSGNQQSTSASCSAASAKCAVKKADPKVKPTTLPGGTGSSPKPPAVAATGFSPYVDMQYDPPFDLAASVKTSGVKSYILGFIVSNGGCAPSWGSDEAIDDDDMVSRVKAFRAVGGDVRISFGGAAGTELAGACTSATSLAAAYQKAIDTFGVTKIDFDIEGSQLSNTAAHVRRGQAIAILERNAKAAGRTLNISLTLPVGPSGWTASPIRVLTSVINAGGTVSVVNVMAMDYGHWDAPDPAGMMGTYAIRGMTAAHATLENIMGLSSSAAWHRMAVTPLIGINSPATEIFTVSDAAKVGAFARSKGAAFVSMWAITRDQPCPAGVTADAESDDCAGNATSKYVFTKAFLG